MDKRISKIIEGSAGGTAGKGNKTYKVAIPTKWVSALHLDKGAIELYFDGDQICICSRLSLSQFKQKKQRLGHALREICFYDGDFLCSRIYADMTDETLCVENYTGNVVKTAFGKLEMPAWTDLLYFLESCLSSGVSFLSSAIALYAL